MKQVKQSSDTRTNECFYAVVFLKLQHIHLLMTELFLSCVVKFPNCPKIKLNKLSEQQTYHVH